VPLVRVDGSRSHVERLFKVAQRGTHAAQIELYCSSAFSLQLFKRKSARTRATLHSPLYDSGRVIRRLNVKDQ
jgi:hypothetical protein